MSVPLALLVPLLALAVVMVFAFAGCELDPRGTTTAEGAPPPGPNGGPPPGPGGGPPPGPGGGPPPSHGPPPPWEHKGQPPPGPPISGLTYQGVVHEIGLSHYWQLADDAGSRDAKDDGPAVALPGTYEPGASPGQFVSLGKDANGHDILLGRDITSAAKFDGGLVTVVYNQSLSLLTAFTVELWANPNPAGQSAVVFGFYDPLVSTGFVLDLVPDAGGSARARVGNFAYVETRVPLGSPAALGGWRYLAMTYDPSGAGTLNLYAGYDNTVHAAPPQNGGYTANNNRDLTIGAGNNEQNTTDRNPTQKFQGLIAQVALYSVALTPQQVKEHFTVGTAQ